MGTCFANDLPDPYLRRRDGPEERERTRSSKPGPTKRRKTHELIWLLDFVTFLEVFETFHEINSINFSVLLSNLFGTLCFHETHFYSVFRDLQDLSLLFEFWLMKSRCSRGVQKCSRRFRSLLSFELRI